VSELDPFRAADFSTDCPHCDGSLAWNAEDGIQGQECSSCGYVYQDTDDPRVTAQAEIRVRPSRRKRPSALAERALA
jgi:uncharacterized metal-binding protein (TIGR02443 family)